MTDLRTTAPTCTAASIAALVFGLGIGAAYADHEPGHKALMETPQRGGEVEPGHEAMTGAGEVAPAAGEQAEAPPRGGEIEMKHEEMGSGGEHAPGHEELMETPQRGGEVQ